MAEKNVEDVKEKVIADNPPQNQDHCDKSVEEIPGPDEKEENHMPSQQQEEETIKKKYGGIVPKKPPLISKDHERAFFDSADWALGKQGAQKPKGPLEALRPKLQPTQQQVRSRRSAYAPSDDGEAGNDGNIDPTAEDNQSPLDGGSNDHVSEDKVSKE